MNNGERRRANAASSGRKRAASEKTTAARALPVCVADVRVGDEITLRFTGYRGVPMYLGGSRAIVKAATRSGFVVEVTSEPGVDRRILANQVLKMTFRRVPVMRCCEECLGTGEVEATCGTCGVDLDNRNTDDECDDLCRKCAAEDTQ